MTPFDVGDIVELRSGGPDMTVAEVEEDMIAVVWFDENNIMRTEALNFNCVTHVADLLAD
jgi:uncharacterized protein YodC (DUF2158 family)